MDARDYPFEIRPLSPDDGGGWLITFPDLPGCMSDGESPQEALENGLDAASCWLAANREMGRPDPEPGGQVSSGRFALRLPKGLYARLDARAKAEGVSMNTMLIALVAEGMGRRESAG